MTAGYYTADACKLEDFAAITAQEVDAAMIPNAADVIHRIPVYDMAALPLAEHRQQIMAEWAQVLLNGPGALVLRGGCPDMAAIDAATDIYTRIIAAEKAESGAKADHFAAGTNDRIWNSLQKLCLAAPEVFAAYFATPAIDAVCEAWLGPGYQMTAQVNLVYPGGAAQQAHRDYHLGFQTAERSARYPAHVHDLSPLMTLQGGIAHVDTPVEGGPTKLLPFSQTYRPGYAAWRRDDFRAHFEKHCVQVPLAKGDAVFFSPALFHAAGENRTSDLKRLVNLLQISSPFGCAMEEIDRVAMCNALYPALLKACRSGAVTEAQRDAVIAASTYGYSFPTNLDTDPPVGGLAPKTQPELMRESLDAGITARAFSEALDAQEAKRRA
ncbi:phytanoyl-CoA dioxygenase family protein [Pseudaestuariivita atlantica]|uniref:Phytanoyl-CoA dioxygenase n=1 Tax=Pseudaestuariivita atlantica TaxID=1317121 RepID=A0A0L1JQ79_9RHOB|nr:phytanoyl-CoA dioxygenase family protein [Pseudaestuariivita atlantica]KNG93558.1 phytanoyl-CoA dioxygenase [Pseudaestuariivita atlantica]